MKYISKWDHIFENFRMYYLSECKGAVDWYPSGPTEITVKFSDGSRLIYEDVNKTVRWIHDLYKRPLERTETEWKQDFSRRLKRIIRMRSMTQLELSARSGIPAPTISLYTTGRSVPSLYAASKLAAALDCSINELMDFED